MIRLYVPQLFTSGVQLALGQAQSHYLAHVMRQREGGQVALFNGVDGEWLAEVESIAKKSVTLRLRERLAAQKDSPDLWLAFAPIKNRMDGVVEKAVELGVSALLPVFTRRCVVKSINHEKLAAYAVEASEQSGRHDVPVLEERKDIAALLAAWPQDRFLLYADECGGGQSLKMLLPALPKGKYGVLVGPEGGFAPEERRMLLSAPQVRPFGLGPRILRADTAAVASLSCLQAWLGDWDKQPDFKGSFDG